MGQITAAAKPHLTDSPLIHQSLITKVNILLKFWVTLKLTLSLLMDLLTFVNLTSLTLCLLVS